jgi:hypothetical protein
MAVPPSSSRNPANRSTARPTAPSPFNARHIAAAWIEGGAKVRAAIAVGALVFASGFIVSTLTSYHILTDIWGAYSRVAFVAGLTVFLGLSAYRSALNNAAIAARLQNAEQRVRDNPDQPIATWDLARAKLESYLDRNLSQVAWIFVLVLIVMSIGFSFISLGVWRVYNEPQAIMSSVVAAVSGILVQFIGATFLLIYRSTMNQARDYVTILERINAVGMSIQILEAIEGSDTKVRDQTRAQLAIDLLRMYSGKPPPGSGRRPPDRDAAGHD